MTINDTKINHPTGTGLSFDNVDNVSQAIAVNNTKIEHTRDLDRVTKEQSRVWRITIRRGGQQMSVVLSG